MNEWKAYKFNEAVDVNPKVEIRNRQRLPFVEMKDVEPTNKFCTYSQLRDLAGGARFQNGDTLFARITPCLENGKIAQVRNLPDNVGFGSTEFHVLRGKEDVTTSEFVYYLSRWDYVRDFAELNLHGTSGRQRFPSEAFGELEILFPPIPEQHSIAEVLSSLDDKIDLLHQQNKTLEALAETLFRQWFDLDNITTRGFLGDFFEETIGGEWGKEIPEGEYNIEVKCFRGTDIGNLYNAIPNPPIRFIKAAKFEKCGLKNGDIVIEISGGTDDQSTGRSHFIDQNIIELFGGKLIFSNFCRLLRPPKKEFTYFLHVYLKYIYSRGDFFNLENGTSGIKNLDLKSFLYQEEYPLPNENVILAFNEKVTPFFTKRTKNLFQIQTLETLRNNLLPKLMSGAVRIGGQ